MSRRRFVTVTNRATGKVVALRAVWCASFACRLRGLMFRRSLAPGEALILVERRATRAGAAIHMLFVPFVIAAVWIDSAGRVVDAVLARPWRPLYAPQAPACYTLEAEPAFLSQVNIGDELDFEDARD
jgi:uncharacterized membrane protein (UPF0127 family)